jgi:hypothetical protein
MESFVLWSLKVWPARGLNKFISAVSILRLCEAVKVQFSDPYKNVGKTKVLCNFKIVSVLTFLKMVLLSLLTQKTICKGQSIYCITYPKVIIWELPQTRRRYLVSLGQITYEQK